MNNKTIKPGTLVTWTSQLKTSTGKVVAFIPKRIPIIEVYREIVNIKHSAIKFDNVSYFSKNDRYLVQVPRLKRNGEFSGEYYYYAPTSHLVKLTAVEANR